ncbi:flagellar basal body P-ring protein FlgI [Aeoliella mucimassa]|uniref:Flagellar basal body P-ring protein n=1 Tax=Aeoliella mucimassa TaxID=2527972 RepID=A0A518ASG6_9BACT|nr:flagellar basal body P-ring protein FlgI [Aeoliella mucimassa]QDU57670.1 flagellar basal body P-ring protein [Aeoliella mucimassa]
MMRRERLSQRIFSGPEPLLVVCLLGISMSVGCMSYIGLPGREKETKTLEDLSDEAPDLVGKYTHPSGMDYVKIEAISLVTGLDGTGEDPAPTPQRAALMAEINRHNIQHAEQLLASTSTSLVLVRGFLRPGIQEGDRFDVEVRTPTRSETTSLRGGWLLSARMTELAVLGQQIRSGHILGVAEGAILVDPSATGEEDEPYATRGRVLGGGVAVKSRPMGLVIDDRYKSVQMATRLAKSINLRFHTRIEGHKRGVADPKNDEYVEISVHPRYKDNIGRYVRVLQSIAVNETGNQQQQRVLVLAEQILDPLTAAKAALQLEALGDAQAIELLQKGMASSDTEVRFYAAEALAYLDDTSAVEVLAQVARDEPAFRINAMAALSAMDDLEAFNALYSLLSADSAETRYGAFRSLWAMNPHDPAIAGFDMNGSFSYHRLNSVQGPPMVHVTNSLRPEIVLFGEQPPLKLPLLVEAGSGLIVNGTRNNQLVISRLKRGSEPERRVIEPEIDELIRTIVELEGTYPDVVQVLQAAKKCGALDSRLRVDALPKPGREYQRDGEGDDQGEVEEGSHFDLATPLPDLFKYKS